MELYSVNLVRYYNYVVEAEDEYSAIDKALRIHKIAENDMRVDDAMVEKYTQETSQWSTVVTGVPV